MLTIALVLHLVGVVFGLGATTVLDLQSAKARSSTSKNSEKWREISLYTQKITRPLAWVGTGLLSASSVIFLLQRPTTIHWIQAGLSVWLILTGVGFTKLAIPEAKRRLTQHDFSPYSKRFIQTIAPLFAMSLIG